MMMMMIIIIIIIIYNSFDGVLIQLNMHLFKCVKTAIKHRKYLQIKEENVNKHWRRKNTKRTKSKTNLQ
jgi:hypothetical protein